MLRDLRLQVYLLTIHTPVHEILCVCGLEVILYPSHNKKQFLKIYKCFPVY